MLGSSITFPLLAGRPGTLHRAGLHLCFLHPSLFHLTSEIVCHRSRRSYAGLAPDALASTARPDVSLLPASAERRFSDSAKGSETDLRGKEEDAWELDEDEEKDETSDDAGADRASACRAVYRRRCVEQDRQRRSNGISEISV